MHEVEEYMEEQAEELRKAENRAIAQATGGDPEHWEELSVFGGSEDEGASKVAKERPTKDKDEIKGTKKEEMVCKVINKKAAKKEAARLREAEEARKKEEKKK